MDADHDRIARLGQAMRQTRAQRPSVVYEEFPDPGEEFLGPYEGRGCGIAPRRGRDDSHLDRAR